MTVDELQNFIADKVHANVDDKIVGEIMNDAANMDYNSFANKWDDFLMEHSEGWSNTRPSDKDVYTRIREAYGSSDKKNPFIIPENYSDEIYESKFKDVPKAEYNKALQAMAKHWDNEKLAREYEAGRVARANEVKEGGPKWWLASEYSKNRYINEPEKSIFSNVGEWYNKGDDVRDVMLGGAGAVGDFIPGYKAILGPVARGVRDYANYDTPYGKNIEDIVKERGLDLGTFGAAAWLQNFRKGKRMLNTAKNDVPVFGKVLENAAFNDAIKGTDQGLGVVMLTKDLDKAKSAIEAMPDNSIKGRLLQEFGDFNQYGNPEAEAAFLEKLKLIANSEAVDLYNYTIAKEGYNYVPRNTEKLGVNVNGLYTSPQRALADKAAIKNSDIKQAARFTPKIGTFGAFVRDKVIPAERAIEQGAAKQLSTQYEAPISDKDRKLRDWYKEHYAKDWSLDKAFKPNEKPGDPLWEAWKEWDDERKGIK